MIIDTSHLIRLLPFLGNQQFDEAIARVDFVEVGLTESIELISSGEFHLHPRQDEPPFGLLDHAEGLLLLKERAGQPIATNKLVEKAADALFRDGKRPATLKGKHLNWCYHQFISPLGEVLTANDFRGSNLFRDIQLLWLSRMNSAPRYVDSAHLTSDALRQKGLWKDPMFEKRESMENEKLPYHRVGANWLVYLDRIKDLSRKFSELVQSCLCEGRILAVDEVDSGGGLVAPSRWQNEAYTFANYHFVFSRDLPEQWFNESTGPRPKSDRQKVNAAVRYLEDQYAISSSSVGGKTKKEHLQDLQDRYRLSKNAAEEAWKMAEISGWKKGGRRKAGP